MMLTITNHIRIPDSEIEIHAVRARGPGGQNVNKVASAVHLRFDINRSSLPAAIRQRLLQSRDDRISRDGILVIKAQRYRSRERNLEDARMRLLDLVKSAIKVKKPRKKTRPPTAARQRRLNLKSRRGQTKRLRSRVTSDE